jgi:hypothetical protein
MSYRNLRSVSRPLGCKILKQPSLLCPQTRGDKPIQDCIGYITSFRDLCSKEKYLLILLFDRFRRAPTLRASTKWLASKLSCSLPTFHRVLRALEGRWLVIRRFRGKPSVYEPGPRLAHVLRRSRLK